MQTLIISAMQEELDICKKELGEGEANFLLTGIGMTETSIALVKYLENAKTYENKFPKRIINIGVVGANNPTLSVGDVIVGSQVKNIDAFVPFKGYEYHTEWIGKSEWRLGTSNAFAMDKSKLPKDIDIVDMEAFAIARIAKEYGIDFIYIKGVSDGKNDDGLDFMQSLEMAMKNSCKKLIEIFYYREFVK